MRLTITRTVRGFSDEASQFAKAVRLPVVSVPGAAAMRAGRGSRIERKPGATWSCGAS
jgi:hypothetical protein